MGEVKLDFLALADAGEQIKKAKPLLNSMNSEDKNRDHLMDLGQLYNGLIGTFAFGPENEVLVKLKEVAELIDNVVKFYRKSPIDEVYESHLTFINIAFDLSSQILDDLVKKGSLTDECRHQFSECLVVYSGLDDIAEAENLDQSEIDDLLDKL